MAAANQSLRPLAICSRCLKSQNSIILPLRSFSTASPFRAAAQAQTSSAAHPSPLVPTDQLDPNLVATVSEEQRLIKKRKEYPIGSRRRRAILSSLKDAVPFEQLPYQCFQEARNVLAEDRVEKLQAITKMRNRISNLLKQDPHISGGEPAKQHRLRSMRLELERLKLLADINDPLVKKRFEDGMGDMNKPIYRYLADKKWREMKRKILLQRITQMSVTPDVLPEIDPVLDIDLIWHHRTITPGDFVPSTWSEKPPELKIQKFDKGEMLVTIAAVDSDVPNLETDSFDARCHGIWTNIAISPTKTDIGKLGRKNSENSKTAQTGKAEGIEQTEATEQIKQSMRTVLPWAPPYAQKGSPYHRISLFVFEQPNGEQLSEEQIKGFAEKTAESDMWLRGFASQTGFKPVGVTMFRTQWDENTAAVMERNNIPGADVEFKRKKPEKLPDKYKVKDGLRYRGWKK